MLNKFLLFWQYNTISRLTFVSKNLDDFLLFLQILCSFELRNYGLRMLMRIDSFCPAQLQSGNNYCLFFTYVHGVSDNIFFNKKGIYHSHS